MPSKRPYRRPTSDSFSNMDVKPVQKKRYTGNDSKFKKTTSRRNSTQNSSTQRSNAQRVSTQRMSRKAAARRRAALRRKRRNKIIAIVCGSILGIILLVVGITYHNYKSSLEPVGDGSNAVVLTIQQGESWDDVLTDMENQKLIKSKFFANIYAKLNKKNVYYAGDFELNDGMSLNKLLSTLANTDNVIQNNITLTFPEGKWAKEIASEISENFDYTQEEIIKKWNDSSYLKELCEDYEFLDYKSINNTAYKVKLEGYLFPNTYEFKQTATIDEITRTFLDGFQTIYDKYKDEFSASSYSVHQLVTLSSIVQFESSSATEMKKIAGVFYNRLDSGMMLQSSVTVCYALYDDFNDPSDCEANYDVVSPYNTYLYTGLPVGPILNPGEDAIVAVLEPTDSDYYFFAADIYGTGKIYYSKTGEEHEEVCKKLGLISEDTTEETTDESTEETTDEYTE